MTLSELEKYINSKNESRLVYTHENNDLGGIQLKILFDSVVVSRFTKRAVFYESAKGRMTDTNSNYLYIDCVDEIIVKHLYPGCDVITITSNDGSHERKYVILYDFKP